MLLVYLSLIETQEEKDRFEYIYLNFRKQMLHIANNMVNNPYDAEDIVHNTFLSVAKNINIFDGREDSSIYSYLVCATKGNAQNFLRKKGNEKKAFDKFYLLKDTDFEYSTIENKIDYDLFIDNVVEVIKELDDLYSNVLYLYVVEDLPYTQIAKLLDRKPGTVKKQIQRGKKLLHSKLNERGLTDER